MATITFYGGVNEIGGNKILVEEGKGRLFFDFGTSFHDVGKYFEEFLQPRSVVGLLDFLEMGLLPPLRGIYRQDIGGQDEGLWRRFQDRDGYREIGVDGVLLSHGHLDHSGYVSFLREDIPIFCTTMTAFLLKALQDSSKSDLEKEICYAVPRVEQGGALVSSRHSKNQPAPALQRTFRAFDLPRLSAEAEQFWHDIPVERPLESQALGLAEMAGPFRLRHFPVDHSIFGAAALAVETSVGWVVYTGDVRLHGRRRRMTEEFVEDAAKLKPAVLLCEGTRTMGEVASNEDGVYTNVKGAVSRRKGLVIADFGPRNIERLLTFARVARETNRQLIITAKDAYLLRAMRLVSPDVPDIGTDPTIKIYRDLKGRVDGWEKKVREEWYSSRLITPQEIHRSQDNYIVCFSFFDVNELPSILPSWGALYLYSSSEVYDEDQAIDMRRLHNWIEHFGMTPVGLPVEVEPHRWEIPDAERGFHASGHASGPELVEMIKEINPRVVIPIHTEHPEFFVERLQGCGIEVRLPAYGQPFSWKGQPLTFGE